MSHEPDRMTRAGSYVLGLMNDEERERAERDMEIDPAFRDAVVALADRMHVFDHGAEGAAPETAWRLIAERISEMPHMRAMPSLGFRRRAGDVASGTGMAGAGWLGNLSAWPAIMVAAALVLAFALGYLTGLWSAG